MPHMIPPGPGVPGKSFHFDPFNRIIEDDDIHTDCATIEKVWVVRLIEFTTPVNCKSSTRYFVLPRSCGLGQKTAYLAFSYIRLFPPGGVVGYPPPPLYVLGFYNLAVFH